MRVVSLPFLHNTAQQHYLITENRKKKIKKNLWHVESLI